MLAWWILLLFMNYLNVGTYGRVSDETYMFYISMIISFLIGYSPSFLYKIRNKYFIFKNDSKKIIFSFYYLMNLILILLILNSQLLNIGFENYFIGVRALHEFSLLGISTLQDNLIKLIIVPCLIFFILIFSYIKDYIKYNFIILVVPVILYSLFFQTNFMISYLFGLLGLYMIENKINYKIIFFLITILVLSAMNRGRGLEILEVLHRYFIDYFTLGFNIFDYLLKNESSFMNDTTYGMSTLLPLDHLLSRLFSQSTPIWFENSNMLNDPFPLTDNIMHQPNAFGTIGFTLYKDFNYLGSILGGLLFGFIMFLLNFTSSISGKFLSVYLVLFSLLSMMVSPFMQLWFWMGLIYLTILLIFERRFFERYN